MMQDQIELDSFGRLAALRLGGRDIPLRTDEWAGPAFEVEWGGQIRRSADAWAGPDGWYENGFWGVQIRHRCEISGGRLRILAQVSNRSSQYFRPERLSLLLGLDTYMDRYPDWDGKCFPTLLRCEPTHCWGYFSSPGGTLLGLACPQPVAGWALGYNHFFCDGGHRIHTARLDLLCRAPLPDRHPQMTKAAPGQTLTWEILLFPAVSVADVLRTAASLTGAPMFDADRLTLHPDEPGTLRLWAPTEPLLTDEDGTVVPLHAGGDGWTADLAACKAPGLHTLRARAGGQISEATVYRRMDWSWYMSRAREQALACPQKTGTHCESWYGLFSGLQAAQYLPDPALDRRILARLDELMPLSFDLDTARPTVIPGRIQNTACLISLLTDAWEATGDEARLQLAARLADFLIDECQGADGAFRNGHGVHYTSVVYIAKSILELYLAERTLGDGWQERSRRHFEAARRAVDELVRNRDNIGTEGEHTFEDGMISCSISQIAMMALLLPENERAAHIAAAETLLAKHRCLERMGSPDCRSRGTTVRFWEAQYDVLIPANMINSPHGWSAWKIYGVWYLYLLTGRTEYLLDAMDTLGSCAQLMEAPSGRLRWGFIPDPQVRTGLWKPDPEHPGLGRLEPAVLGESYVDMISGWYRAPEGTPVFGYLGAGFGTDTDQGGCCDNDVHEIFKCMAEVALPWAFVAWRDERALAVNCTVSEVAGLLHIRPAEALVRAVHVCLPDARPVCVHFAGGDISAQLSRGWVGRDGDITDGLPPVL